MTSNQDGSRRIGLSILGVDLAILLDPGPAAELIAAEFAPFAAAPEDQPTVDLRRREGAALAPDQVFVRAFRAVLDRVERFVVLHAAAVAHGDRAFLLAGPSGSGKTSLALGLVARGMRLLSDDFAPLDRRTRRIHPFPKPLGIREGPGMPLAAALAGRGEAAVLGREHWQTDPLPAGGILFMDGGPRPPDPNAPYRMRVRCRRSPEAVAAALAAQRGVAIAGSDGAEVTIEVSPREADPIAIERELEGAGGLVVEYGTAGAPPAAPGAAASVLALPAAAALVVLLREVQNRRLDGALVRSLGGDPMQLALELGPWLASMRRAWLSPGTIDVTVDLVERTIIAWSAP